MQRVILLLTFSLLFCDVLCRDAKGSVRWYSGNNCPSGLTRINMARLSNFKIDAPFPYVVLFGSTSSPMSATGTEYLKVFGSSAPSNTSQSFFNSFKCKSFKLYIETDSNSSCTSGFQRKFLLWNPSGGGSQIGTAFVQLPAGASGTFSVSVSQEPPLLALRTEVVSGSCPNNATWTLFCK
ncbi:MAG: hypothetical protein NZO16_05150 [Deltaproteobacteria bacterium]|nr:hypothetical protein [Deltaproteobacteria bacterium]